MKQITIITTALAIFAFAACNKPTTGQADQNDSKRNVSAANIAYESITSGMTLNEAKPHLDKLVKSLNGKTEPNYMAIFADQNLSKPVGQIIEGNGWKVTITLKPDQTVEQVTKSGF